ncbi:ABC transporter substrate binding protein [Thermodesulfobacteriota bacterium]
MALLLSFLPGFPNSVQCNPAKVYRLGFPLSHKAPPYQWLLDGLAKKGFVVGENLQVVPIDLQNFHTKPGREKIRQELADSCDLFFTGGASLEVLYKIEPHSPLLFINVAGLQRNVPSAMQDNTTGVRIGSESGIFQQAVEMLPLHQRQKLGLIFFKESKISLMASGFQQTCARLGLQLMVKEYVSKENIASVMQDFKGDGVGGVVLFPSAAHDEDLAELIAWQNKLKLPIISIIKQDIEKGLFGGPTINHKMVKPNLSDYAAKILQGRSPGQLPVKYFSPEYVLNLATASRLGIAVPAEVVNQADIVGLTRVAAKEESAAKPLVAGTFVVGLSQHTALPSVKRFLKEFAKRGYVQGKNLHVQQFDLDVGDDPLKQRQLAERLAKETDVIFANGSVLPSFTHLPDLKTPVCFVSTKETASTIPAGLKQYFTGVIRASFGSIIESVMQIIPATKRVVMIGRPGSKLAKTIKRHQKTAKTFGITLDYRMFSDKTEIGPLMRALHKKNDVMLLYSPGVDDECIAEIIHWQNQLGFPVLAQFERHVRKGILAGMVVDMDKVSPKLAEYTDKLIQGRSPEQLPYYYYPGKFIINLRTASKLRLDIPVEVTSQAEIVR